VSQLAGGGWHVPGYYEGEYGNTIFGDFDGMLQLILILGAACVAAGIVLSIAGKRLSNPE
jgi:hypothetical protein